MPRFTTFSALISLTMLASCGPRTVPLRVDARHPASPHAPEGRPVPEWIGLLADEFDQAVAPARVGVGAASDSGMPAHEEHAAPAHRGHDPGSRAPAPKAVTPSPRPPGSARDTAQPAATFACPMHPEVTDTRASECPKCGMTLVRQKEKQP
jgi:hypothetical protein